MFKVIKILKSVDDIKLGKCISLFVGHCKNVYLFKQFIDLIGEFISGFISDLYLSLYLIYI